MWGSVQVLPTQVSIQSFTTFENIDLRGFRAKLQRKPSETLRADSI